MWHASARSPSTTPSTSRRLVLWGRHDTAFDIDEVLASHQALTTFEAHIFDAGHFLLETHAAEVADLLVTFTLDAFDRAGVAV